MDIPSPGAGGVSPQPPSQPPELPPELPPRLPGFVAGAAATVADEEEEVADFAPLNSQAVKAVIDNETYNNRPKFLEFIIPPTSYTPNFGPTERALFRYKVPHSKLTAEPN